MLKVGDTVRLVKLCEDDANDEACPVVVGVIGKVIEDPDGGFCKDHVCVEWSMPVNPVVWVVPMYCVEKI